MGVDAESWATTVRGLVERAAAATPAASFVIDPDSGRSLSFAGLHRRSLAVAAKLAADGLDPGDRVALLLPNGCEAVALFVGIMAAGCVVTPLSLLASPAQLAYVLDHSDCRLVFVGPDRRDVLRLALGQVGRPIVVRVVDEDEPDRAADGADWPWQAPPGAADALLIYTSGTTGRPKGVRLSHGNVLAGARFVSQAHRLGPGDRVLAILPLYHINAQIVTVLSPLDHCGSLVMPRRFSTGRFWSLVAEWRCTWLNVVPTIIAYLLNGEATPQQEPGVVRFCRSASAPLAPEHQRRFERRFGIGVIETMGLTETAAQVFANPPEPELRKVGSAGRAFGSQARVVDLASGGELPAGATGEIQIRGPNVMSGYHKDPEATAAAMAPGGWLRTGDLGHRDEQGFFFVTGRLKELIIKGGENIAPREIDEVLLSHPAVLEAAAVAVPDPFYGQEIEAGVVLKPGTTLDEAELRAFCEAALGRFKTPRAIRFLASLPKGPSGKLQRLRLQEMPGKEARIGV
jgi:long-chain acyl-CoA synthetase